MNDKFTQLKIKKLHPDAITPTRSHPHDAGLDIYAAESVALIPQEKHLLSTGIAVDIPPGCVGLLTSRSGVSSKTNLVIETGKIDAGYNGEMKINIKNDEPMPSPEVDKNNRQMNESFEPLLYNVKGERVENGNPFNLISGKEYAIEAGDKIAQLLIVPIITPGVEVVKEFESESARGTNGFGSTDR